MTVEFESFHRQDEPVLPRVPRCSSGCKCHLRGLPDPRRRTGERTARAVRDRPAAGRLDQLTIEETEPAPWKQGWTSLMWAAEHGLVAETADLLERGAPTTSPTAIRDAVPAGDAPWPRPGDGGAARAPERNSQSLPRPPGAAGAVVMRPYIGWVFWWLAPIAPDHRVDRRRGDPVVGAGCRRRRRRRRRSPRSACLAHVLAGRTTVAVDGPQLYTRRFWRWRGPVDLRNLAAIGLRESIHRRSPTCFDSPTRTR